MSKSNSKSKSLVIVESPGKSKTIGKFLGENFIVKASIGHIRDLPQKALGVDIENNFEPKYIVLKDKVKIIKELQQCASEVDRLFLAADPDREGEAICWHLAHELKKTNKPIQRIIFNEITKKAIQEAIRNPTEINQNLVKAQQARRILDRLVGYQISPILWKSVKSGLSAGRVQSVALRLICDREVEIENFKSQEYWSLIAKLRGDNTEAFEAKLFKMASKKADIGNYGFLIDEAQANSMADEAKKRDFVVSAVQRKERRQNPAPPFITSKLQQEAARKLRFSANKTMLIAQELYEGLEIGSEGSAGLITYMRTDSTRVADEAIGSVRSFIKGSYGEKSLPEKPNYYKSKKGAQDAHEAVRPTAVEREPEKIKGFLSRDQYLLYDLIWKRFVASQMTPAIIDVSTIDISAGDYLFRAVGSVIKFKGFMSVYLEGRDEPKSDSDSDEDGENLSLPELFVGQKLTLLSLTPKQHFTQPPPRYSEATLIKELEEKGIGRPSTYAAIVSTIQDRNYVAKEKGSFQPTDIGRLVNQLLIRSFPDIMDVKFTAKMEEQLDEVEEGQANWVEVLKKFYNSFSQLLQKAPAQIRDAKKELEEISEEICDKCGRNMIIKWGRYGRFLACSGYPECQNIKNIKSLAAQEEKAKAEEPTDAICEKCNSPMVIKTGRYGRFLACSSYPKCKNTKTLGLGIKCPKPNCDGELVARRTKKGRTFYGCSKFPQCDFSIWDKPIAEKCPRCNAPFLVEKSAKDRPSYLACINPECKPKI